MPIQVNPHVSLETGYPDKHLVWRVDQFASMMRFLEQSPVVVFDFETSGLRWFDKASACGIALAGIDASGAIQSFYTAFRHDTYLKQLPLETIHAPIGALLRDERKLKIAHHAKFDLHMAEKEGWQVAGPLYDTMIAAKLRDENRPVGLKARAESDLGRTDATEWESRVEEEVRQLARRLKLGKEAYLERYGYSQVCPTICGTYACFDVEFTALLYQAYETHQLSQVFSRVWNTEMQLIPVLCDMETFGLPIDVPYVQDLRARLRAVQQRLEASIAQLLPGVQIRLSADDDLRDFLVRRLRLPLSKETKGGKLAVDHDVLETFAHAHPAISLIAEWREAEKIANTYTGSILSRLDSQNLLHADYQQTGTVTGRLSCSNPNFQNQPVDDDARAKAHCGKGLQDGGADPWSVRRAYCNRGQGWVRLFFDYSQIELRVLAKLSNDPVMVDAYVKGEDIHDRTSLEVFGTKEKAFRRKAKVINFGLSYGMSQYGLAPKLKISVDEAAAYLDRFFERYAGVARFRQEFWGAMQARKGVFQNLFGRPRRVAGMMFHNPDIQREARRQAFASLVQGTAAELTKESLVRIARFFKDARLPARLVATVHDEIQIDTPVECLPEVARGVKQRMEAFPEFAPIPIIVDGSYSTTNWSEKKSLPF